MSPQPTPVDLARELGVTGVRLRAFLRHRYPAYAPGKGATWVLTAEQVDVVRDYFGRRRKGIPRSPEPEPDAASLGPGADARRPDDAEVSAAVRGLLAAANRVPAAHFPRAGDPGGEPGLYAWFVDVEGATQLSTGLGLPILPGLIYAGQAGAGASSATLQSLVLGNHLGGAITGSTFRLTLAALLAPALSLVDVGGRQLAADGETRLTAWMRQHLAVAVTPEPDRAALPLLEGAALARLDPPLNLQGMPASAVRSVLTAKRRRPLGRRSSAAGARPVTSRVTPSPTPSGPVSGREHIALVGCVKSKRVGTHPARDLFVSPLFTARRTHVEAAGLRWWILSAKYGLVAPDERIAAYEQTLNDMSAVERRAWGDRVLAQLQAELGDLGQHSFEIHAGSRYAEAIEDGLRAAGAVVEIPAAGLGLGQQLAWYGGHAQG